MNILLTDIMFPNKYAKWRLVEIKSFIDEFKCDILCVSRINSYANIQFDFDWDILKDQFNLDEYDILIFNSRYNYLNKYNSSIDGTIYNRIINADYMLRHKSKRSQLVNFDTYDDIPVEATGENVPRCINIVIIDIIFIIKKNLKK